MSEWHKQHREQMAHIAEGLAELYNPSFEAQQPPEFVEAQRGFLWAMHVYAEHDKFKPPEYGDHRNG